MTTAGPLVLLVAEDADLRLLIERMLVRSGFSVVAADNAVEGARIFADRQTEIGLLVTDVDLTFLSGLELAAMITSVKPELPVLIVAGRSEALEMRDQIGRRGWAFVAKPFAMAELAQAARAVIQQVSGQKQRPATQG